MPSGTFHSLSAVLEAQSERQPGSYERGTEEFSRVLAFSDGVFAIAMTLLVVGIAVPELKHVDKDSVHNLANALDDLVPNFVSFFISFAVIGRYWAAHHEFVGLLARIDTRLIASNLVYLAFIAFLPFPTALLGTLFENPLSVALYAVMVAIISGLEVVQFRGAQRRGLMGQKIPEDVYRWGVIQSLSPVIFFLISVPVAFVSTTLAVVLWFGGIPFAAISNRWKPEDADRYLAH
ncbi:MAG: TMEM175 family protein [Solirubrobacterales bacterium]